MPVIGSPVVSAPGLVTDEEVAAQVPNWADLDAATRSALILAASAAVESYCRRTFSATDFDEYYSSDATGRLFLRTRPIISITEISRGTVHTEAPVVIEPTSYDYDPVTGEVWTGGSGSSFWVPYGGGWNYSCGGSMGGYRNVRVQYRGGYEPEDIPMDVKQATILAIRSLHGGTARDPSISSISRGGRSISYAATAQSTVMTTGPVQDLLSMGGIPVTMWEMPDFPSATFDSETVTLRPRLPSTRGLSGAPTVVLGEPVELPCQIDPVSGEVAAQAGLDDLRAVYEIHLSSDPGEGFAEGAQAVSAQTGPATVTAKLHWAPNHIVLTVQGRGD